jgi:hypothetical protein
VAILVLCYSAKEILVVVDELGIKLKAEQGGKLVTSPTIFVSVSHFITDVPI